MDNERFEQLKSSIIDAGRIMRGEIMPSRVFEIEVIDRPSAPAESWAVCLDSDDHSLLIPRKLYLVRFVDGGVWVRDENGEMTSCDSDDFVPISLAKEAQELFAEAA